MRIEGLDLSLSHDSRIKKRKEDRMKVKIQRLKEKKSQANLERVLTAFEFYAGLFVYGALTALDRSPPK